MYIKVADKGNSYEEAQAKYSIHQKGTFEITQEFLNRTITLPVVTVCSQNSHQTHARIIF